MLRLPQSAQALGYHPSSLLLCPTPHYAPFNFAVAAAAIAAAASAANAGSGSRLGGNQQQVVPIIGGGGGGRDALSPRSNGSNEDSTNGSGSVEKPLTDANTSNNNNNSSTSGDSWLLAKSSSIAELRLKAKQYMAGLELK
jgi:hypothetical protein